MKKMRVFELAKELNIDARELMKVAKDLAISVENNMSLIDVHDIGRIKKRFVKETEKQPDELPQESYVEKRVSANIIRRRARVAPSPEKQVVEPSEPEEVTAVEAVEEKPEKKEQKKAPKPVEEEQPAAAEAETPSVPAGEAAEVAPEPAVPQEGPVAAPSVPEERPEAPAEEQPREKEAPEVKPAPPVPLEEEKEAEKKEEKKKKEKKKGKKVKAPEIIELPEEGEDDIARHAAKKLKKPKEKEKEVYTQSDLYGSERTVFGKKQKKRRDRRAAAQSMQARKKKIRIGRAVTVSSLAKEMGVKASDVIRILMDLGVMANMNQYITADEASFVASELGFEVEEVRDEIKETYLVPPTFSPEELEPRPPVVTVMGHVDHGKTSLLDAIRQENVIDSEYGGITQHIGAYQARCNGKTITFIDTPGHEAFTSMRSRGAQVTDFVVLVVAADDGVMDQTREAINHARAANIPILVAVNKIDKPGANPQRVREQLAEIGLVPESWGGDTIFVDVSAKNRIGIDDLLEMILLQAEVLDIKSSRKDGARGVVLESKLDKARGPMATVLIQSGELKRGDTFVVGSTWGRARGMFDFTGKPISQATPAMPVEIIGFSELPSAGDTFFVVPNEKKAKDIVSYFRESNEIQRQQRQEPKEKVTLEDLYSQVREGKIKDLNLIIKGDVHGTVEAIQNTVTGIDTGEDLRVNVIHSAVGGITENDVLLASTADAIVIGFNVRPEPTASALAKKYNVEIKLYTIIYDLIEDIKKALKGMLEPVYEEIIQGRAQVRDLFKVPKVGTIAGCMVTEGQITRGANVRLLRDNVVVFEGKVDSLKRFKEDVREVQSGYECGIGLSGFNDIKTGDVIEAYTHQKVEAEIE
ncbi:MAG: translation initiation factor IF-2 [Desulfomonilia bacterium]|jgi:translation initiation factor IF-2|uniref:Translation initiation factor IF-2 n=1 Tax=anaerobic digester metagenome TaxID=1263854 RepID=A0A485LZU4_9ZZZZ